MNTRKFAIIVTLLAVLFAGTVINVAAQTPMHVAGFNVSYLSGTTRVGLRVLDAMNRPVAGARVQISFEKEGAAPLLRSGTTGTFGYARISTVLPRGTWRVCVEEIHKLGYDYSPANQLCRSISVP